jgi:hypothetical protein
MSSLNVFSTKSHGGSIVTDMPHTSVLMIYISRSETRKLVKAYTDYAALVVTGRIPDAQPTNFYSHNFPTDLWFYRHSQTTVKMNVFCGKDAMNKIWMRFLDEHGISNTESFNPDFNQVLRNVNRRPDVKKYKIQVGRTIFPAQLTVVNHRRVMLNKKIEEARQNLETLEREFNQLPKTFAD